MARANQTVYRQFYREVFTPALVPFQFKRVGLQNVWRKDTSGELVQLIGAAAAWFGGSRAIGWEIFVPGLDNLMQGDGPPLPLGGRVALGYCHVSGLASDLIRPEVLADHPELAADFELMPDQTLEDRVRLESRVQSTLRLFGEHLGHLQTLENLLRLLTVDDPVGDRRYMPNKVLTPIYATGIAILANSQDLQRVVVNLEAERNAWGLPEGRLGLPSGTRVWGPVVDRLLKVAHSMAN
jgi:hypothetical protein